MNIKVDHIFFWVSELRTSEIFYDKVMKIMNFRKGTNPINDIQHIHYFNSSFQLSILELDEKNKLGSERNPGLHHLCFRVDNKNEVDKIAIEFRKANIPIEGPDFFPQYGEDYYAFSFYDPDGIHLEIVLHTELRKIIRNNWERFSDFEDPLEKLNLFQK